MSQSASKTVGETLIDLLEVNDVEVVFGIPGVHTVELYRGLAGSNVRHVTPRHEQSAGFMADGYARVSGKPGVCLVITGPGLTNTITAMAQARADSIPMLVISGVNARKALGHGEGALHELPDQSAMIKSLAIHSHTLLEPNDLATVIDRAFSLLGSARPGPVHIEIPTDVMSERIPAPELRATKPAKPRASAAAIAEAVELCNRATRPTILAGGGANSAPAALTALAECLDAPVVSTTNARGLLGGHPLRVPASPSAAAVRALLAESDLVLAVGTEMGPTDYDMYADGQFPVLANLIRIDIDGAQLTRGQSADLALLSTAEAACQDLLDALPDAPAARDGAARANATRGAAFNALSPKLRHQIGLIDTIQETLPGCIMIGDSTQLAYAGNLYCDIARPKGWFNAATGFGALGFGPPAAIGASIAAPGVPVVCIAGDGGLQFTLAELGSAMDENTPVIFVVWNNDGYQEIERYMVENGITPIGVKPSPPDFMLMAQAYGLTGQRLGTIGELPDALTEAAARESASLIEIHETNCRF